MPAGDFNQFVHVNDAGVPYPIPATNLAQVIEQEPLTVQQFNNAMAGQWNAQPGQGIQLETTGFTMATTATTTATFNPTTMTYTTGGVGYIANGHQTPTIKGLLAKWTMNFRMMGTAAGKTTWTALSFALDAFKRLFSWETTPERIEPEARARLDQDTADLNRLMHQVERDMPAHPLPHDTGTRTWLTGVGRPEDTMGQDGDVYLRTDNGVHYRRTFGAWYPESPIVDDQPLNGRDEHGLLNILKARLICVPRDRNIELFAPVFAYFPHLTDNFDPVVVALMAGDTVQTWGHNVALLDADLRRQGRPVRVFSMEKIDYV